MQFDITGTNTTVETAAVVESTRQPDLDFSGDITPATAAFLIGSSAPSLDFTTTKELDATLNVDDGADQPIVLDALYADIDDLIDELQSQTTGATWGKSSGKLTLTSDTANSDSSLNLVIDTESTSHINIEGDDEGTDEISPYVAHVAVDGGVAQDLILDAVYANLDELIVEINSQLSGCTASTSPDASKSSILIITSDTTGSGSEIDFTVDVETKPGHSLYIDVQDVEGTEETVTGNTILAKSWGGSVENPTSVTVQNVAPDPSDPFTGPVLEVERSSDLTFGRGIQIYAGASASFELVSGDTLYATADNGETVDTRVDAVNPGTPAKSDS